MVPSFSARPDFQDRAGAYLIFAEAVCRIGADKFESKWAGPASVIPPMILPETIFEATKEQTDYACHLLLQNDPDIDPNILDGITNHGSVRFDDRFGHWAWASLLSNIDFEEQKRLHNEIVQILDLFADHAVRGQIKCSARDKDRLAQIDIDKNCWNVTRDTLVERLKTGMIRLPDAKNRMREWIIVVDAGSLPALQKDQTVDRKTREEVVRSRLWDAKVISDKVVPHANIGQLRIDIGHYLGCSNRNAGRIIDEVTDKCWSETGRKPSNTSVNQIKIT